MEAGNVNAMRPRKILVSRKHLTSQHIRAEDVPGKSLNNDGHTRKKCFRNSGDISGEYEQKAQFNATSYWVENQQGIGAADCKKLVAGAKILFENPTPLAIDPSVLVGDEEDMPLVKETDGQLEAEIERLRRENSKTCQRMQELSVSCVQLRKENRHLLKELKKVCAPDTIAYLEARNPDRKVDKGRD